MPGTRYVYPFQIQPRSNAPNSSAVLVTIAKDISPYTNSSIATAAAIIATLAPPGILLGAAESLFALSPPEKGLPPPPAAEVSAAAADEESAVEELELPPETVEVAIVDCGEEDPVAELELEPEEEPLELGRSEDEDGDDDDEDDEPLEVDLTPKPGIVSKVRRLGWRVLTNSILVKVKHGVDVLQEYVA